MEDMEKGIQEPPDAHGNRRNRRNRPVEKKGESSRKRERKHHGSSEIEGERQKG